ncbi:MAG: DUF2062 domain-containing protein [Zetaproteobacteria bacterium CG12_big_fil_rev_8_21_14_0_65_55_1124]|nr:MAG: ATP-binding protein [Zetaproteobacteria bacterium CG1_02_55_237]PIS19650.1 MAG: DUF2062 domain-containing protein [Zetaproteobacteria bacterium CG08_land_8_20_14_0_20_55_17]PIW41991.1 MAG: DUF2062 domain-containing protein [Zetaproteobacteria bacterium CG12_big_fil_rev_8_21_14_0_65_55_1124]PIY53868.1 MAG: DUF2062 domain-containing protein [Zetaproteobacteria bacterium CG_4_10_14_0_8_um_filter_55_43]PIZ37047.1 MAG: DUF2062 domain-containing protein [Zetaproteobacteria bacterium CG_4_10_1
MPRKLIKRFMPDHKKIREQKCLRFLGTRLHNPSLWHLNRHSVAGAFFIGLFCAFMPIPFQMVLAAVLAVFFHVNIPISVALVWLTNPLTMPSVFYFCYEVGQWMLGMPDAEDFHFEANWQWMINLFSHSWQPFLLGCLVCGLVFGIVGYVAVHVLWRSHVTFRWRNRRKGISKVKVKVDAVSPASKQTASQAASSPHANSIHP